MDIVLVGLVVLNCVLRHFLCDRFGSENGRIGRYLFDGVLGVPRWQKPYLLTLVRIGGSFLNFYFRKEAEQAIATGALA
jgi:hypothetical protein